MKINIYVYSIKFLLIFLIKHSLNINSINVKYVNIKYHWELDVRAQLSFLLVVLWASSSHLVRSFVSALSSGRSSCSCLSLSWAVRSHCQSWISLVLCWAAGPVDSLNNTPSFISQVSRFRLHSLSGVRASRISCWNWAQSCGSLSADLSNPTSFKALWIGSWLCGFSSWDWFVFSSIWTSLLSFSSSRWTSFRRIGTHRVTCEKQTLYHQSLFYLVWK